VLLSSLWLAGCDTAANQEDRKVQADVAQAQAIIGSAQSPGATDEDRMNATRAGKTLENAASDALISPMTRAIAKSALAQTEVNSASKIMHQIDLDDATLHSLIWEISQLTQQVDKSRAVAAGYDKYDPKPAHDAIADFLAAAQGGPDKPEWFKLDNSSMPSLTAVTQTISQLQTQIAKQADDLKALQDQRTQVLDNADQADQSSASSKGQQSVDDFKHAADLRKQAGDLTVQIEKNQAQTIPLQKDLAVAQGQQVVLQELIKEFQDQSQALDAGWKSVQDTLASQAVLQKQIVAGTGEAAPAPAAGAPGAAASASVAESISPTAGQSLNDKADALGKLVKAIHDERLDALADLNNAIQHYRDAGSAAKLYVGALDPIIKDPNNAQRPEKDAWQNLEDTINPAAYNMQEALAQRQLASLYLSQIDDDNRRAQLQDEASKLLGAANLPVPTALSDTGLDADKTASAKSASDAYAAAETQIENLTSGGPPVPLKNLARVESILTLYGQVQLAREMGDAAAAKDKLDQAIAKRAEATDNSLQLPPLPPEITAPAAPAAPVGAPGT
jgi:hypothetical protein